MISRIYTVHMDDLVRLLQYHDLLEETGGFPEKNDSSRLIQERSGYLASKHRFKQKPRIKLHVLRVRV